ncbi:MAG: YjdF family protein [Oscillospiraceae bacterium]|nr:YjdF family protein [Oscillospiraceae bacterium]MDE7172031.1 YjdF family protein [Oscillospiraceae bacterium]
MCVSKASLTVYFEPPFWVGLYQREDEDGCRVCKITFGAEPKDQEVLDWLLSHWRELRFSPPIVGNREINRLPSPKRMRREARKATQTAGTGTKAQQALQLQREQQKAQRKADSKEHREAERERKLVLRQEKRRQKHRGH